MPITTFMLNKGHRRFTVFKRAPDDKHARRIGTVLAQDLTQANTKVRQLYGRTLRDGDALWAEEQVEKPEHNGTE